MRMKKSNLNPRMLRPFTEDDLSPVLDGFSAGPPDFIGVGTGKAGTTWWHQLILRHPDAIQNRLNQKELSFFYHFGYRDIDLPSIEVYNKAFNSAEGKICGEWSPGYLNYPFALNNLSKAVPNVKILVLIRNPVDRVLSAINQKKTTRERKMNLKGDNLYIYNTYSTFQLAIYKSFLYEGLLRLLELFDRSNILLLQYEKCKVDPEIEIARTYRFFGIDDIFKPMDITKRVNQKKYIVAKLNYDEQERLAGYFINDVTKVKELFPEIDLSLWSDFVNLQ